MVRSAAGPGRFARTVGPVGARVNKDDFTVNAKPTEILTGTTRAGTTQQFGRHLTRRVGGRDPDDARDTVRNLVLLAGFSWPDTGAGPRGLTRVGGIRGGDKMRRTPHADAGVALVVVDQIELPLASSRVSAYVGFYLHSPRRSGGWPSPAALLHLERSRSREGPHWRTRHRTICRPVICHWNSV